jgi:hypothetical protein
MLFCLIVALLLTTLIIEPALAQKKLTAAEAKDRDRGSERTCCVSSSSVLTSTTGTRM